MNHLKEISVDEPIKLSDVSGDDTLHIKRVTTDKTKRIKGVDQGGTSIVENYDYNPLLNHPMIEGNELIGDKTYPELGLDNITPQEIDEIIFGG